MQHFIDAAQPASDVKSGPSPMGRTTQEMR